MENQDMKTTSRQQELIDRIIELQGRLEDAKLGIGNNQIVKNHKTLPLCGLFASLCES